MKVAIFGCRDGRYLYEQIKKNGKGIYQVCYFADNDSKYHNTQISGISVLDIQGLVKKYKQQEFQKIIIAVRKGYSRYCIIEQLKKEGINNILLLKPSPLTYELPIIFDKEQEGYNRYWMDLSNQKKVVIHHLESHAADGCNLNCKGCLHFSNLYNRKELPDLLKLLKDIQKISENCEIFQFRILGGEPLLNPGLARFLVNLRKLLPDTDIAVISNGILIPQMPEELFITMRDTHIGFNLSLYPPTLKMKKIIFDVLDRYHVAYGSHEAKTDEFEKFLMLESSEIDMHAYEFCVSRGILILKNGKLYKCPITAYVNRYFDTFLIGQHYEEGIDIYNERLDWNQLIKNLSIQEGGFCRHCSCNSERFTWSTGKAEYEDWLITERK